MLFKFQNCFVIKCIRNNCFRRSLFEKYILLFEKFLAEISAIISRISKHIRLRITYETNVWLKCLIHDQISDFDALDFWSCIKHLTSRHLTNMRKTNMRKTSLTFYQIVCDHNFASQLLNALRIDFFHFCNIEFRSFSSMKVIFYIMILYSNMSKDENENVKQKKCNSNSIFQIVKLFSE